MDTGRDARSVHAQKNDHVRAQREGGHLQGNKRDFWENQIHHHWIGGFSLQNCKKFLFFKPLGLWYFVIIILADF